MNTIDASVKFYHQLMLHVHIQLAYKGNTTCFEGYEEHSDSGVIHEMLNCRISLLGRHTSFKSADLEISFKHQAAVVMRTYIKPSSSKSESDQIEE
jgi:hypothetical protein